MVFLANLMYLRVGSDVPTQVPDGADGRRASTSRTVTVDIFLPTALSWA
jgi:hypothetical protein